MKKIQDLGGKFKIIQDYPRFWQKNQDAKHWVVTNNSHGSGILDSIMIPNVNTGSICCERLKR